MRIQGSREGPFQKALGAEVVRPEVRPEGIEPPTPSSGTSQPAAEYESDPKGHYYNSPETVAPGEPPGCPDSIAPSLI